MRVINEQHTTGGHHLVGSWFPVQDFRHQIWVRLVNGWGRANMWSYLVMLMEEYDENGLPAISFSIRQTRSGTVKCSLIGSIETIYSCLTTNGQRTRLKAKQNQLKPTKQAGNKRFMIKKCKQTLLMWICTLKSPSFFDWMVVSSMFCFPFCLDDPNWLP